MFQQLFIISLITFSEVATSVFVPHLNFDKRTSAKAQNLLMKGFALIFMVIFLRTER